jgi:membrane-bound metal-dependent hydrolase YbcI (DUF457 family)
MAPFPSGGTGEKTLYAVGHIALGYLISKGSAKALNTRLNIPLVILLAVIPDVDILFRLVQHRGPTHSVVAAIIVFLPLLFVYRKQAVPYLLALIQHSLIGDFIAARAQPVQLFWPVTTSYFGLTIDIRSPTNVAIEWAVFLVSMIVLFLTEDFTRFITPHKSNLILVIPTFALLLPIFSDSSLHVPAWLIPPHLVFATIFLVAVTIEFLNILTYYPSSED